MHTPVAAVPGVAHLVPSVAPLAHTNETKASSSPQRTVSVPVTRRKGGAGAGSPFGPGGPAEPGGPASPCGPCAPLGSGPLWTLCARWTSRPLWTRHGLAASADCQHREKGKTVQKLPHRQTLPAMCNSLHPPIEHRQETKSLRCPLWVKSGHVQCKRPCPLYPRKRTLQCVCPLCANSGHVGYRLRRSSVKMTFSALA